MAQFVEDLTSQVLRGSGKKRDEEDIDTRTVLEAFEQSVDTLQGMGDKTGRRIEKLSKVCQEEERRYLSSLSHVERAVSVSQIIFKNQRVDLSGH